MASQAKKTDKHDVVVKTVSPGGSPIYGTDIFSIVNPNTMEEVDRVQGFGNALTAQARENAKVRATGL